jgi:hypothetical protein
MRKCEDYFSSNFIDEVKVKMSISYVNPSLLREDMVTYQSVLGLCEKCMGQAFQLDNFIQQLDKADEVQLVFGAKDLLIGFSLFEVLELRNAKFWPPPLIGISLLYLSAVLIHPLHQDCGVGSQMTRHLLARHSPNCLCTTSSRAHWVASTQRTLTKVGYRSYSGLSHPVPRQAYTAAKSVLMATNRITESLTPGLVRVGIYTESEGMILNDGSAAEFGVNLRPADSLLLIAFDSNCKV